MSSSRGEFVVVFLGWWSPGRRWRAAGGRDCVDFFVPWSGRVEFRRARNLVREWSKVIDRVPLPGEGDVGLRLFAVLPIEPVREMWAEREAAAGRAVCNEAFTEFLHRGDVRRDMEISLNEEIDHDL